MKKRLDAGRKEEKAVKATGIIAGPANPRSIALKAGGTKDLLEISMLEDTLAAPAKVTIWGANAEITRVLLAAKRGQKIAFDVRAVGEFGGTPQLEPVEGSLRIE